MPDCLICQKKFPNRVVIDGKRRNLCNRKYCLDCSPWDKHNTKQLHVLPSLPPTEKKCPRCKLVFSRENFHKRRSGSGFSVYCKKCTTIQTLERMHKFKKFCLEYKGGKCENCGYNKCRAALEFHHLDVNKKEFSIGQSRLKRVTQQTLDELDKCQLLCANCHREAHNL